MDLPLISDINSFDTDGVFTPKKSASKESPFVMQEACGALDWSSRAAYRNYDGAVDKLINTARKSQPITVAVE